MADEIEKHLEAKIINGIEKVKGAEKHGIAKQAVAKQLTPRFIPAPAASASPNQPKLTRDKLYNLNNLLAEWQIHSKQPNSYPFESFIYDFNFKRNITREIPIKTEPQVAANANSQTPQPSTHEPSASRETEEARWSTRYVDPEKVYGIDDKAKSLQRMLVKDKGGDPGHFKSVGIVGMRGIGKTTLCQIIFGMKEVKSCFLPRIWVCVSKKPNDDGDSRKEIVKRMLRCLGAEDKVIDYANEQHQLKGLLYALRLQLMGKKYLIVLDDVWIAEEKAEEYKDFYSFVGEDEKCSEKLAYGLPKGYGGAVIVTSRTEELAEKMVGEDNLHRITPLSNEHCWHIFKDSFGEADGRLLETMESLKMKITDKCEGLPLAARMMGQIAKEQIAERERGSQ